MSILLLVNKRSRSGEVEPDGFARRLEEQGLAVRRPPPALAEDLDAAIRQAHEDVHAVAIGGGDGTINVALQALLDRRLPLLVIPLGTGNDLARTLGLPLDPLAAIDLAAKGQRQAIDIGTVNGRPFLNVASLGLTIDVAQLQTPAMKKLLGPLSYPVASLRALRRMRSFKVLIRGARSERRLRSVQLSVGNGRFYGGGLVVDDRAEIDDGIMHLYSLAPRSIWSLMASALHFRAGRHREVEHAETMSSPWFEIETDRNLPISADGEVISSTPARFEVKRGALEVFVPRAGEEG